MPRRWLARSVDREFLSRPGRAHVLLPSPSTVSILFLQEGLCLHQLAKAALMVISFDVLSGQSACGQHSHMWSTLPGACQVPGGALMLLVLAIAG